MLTCKHCGEKNEPKSRFCEACGKRMRRGSQSDGMFVLLFILFALIVGVYAYMQGYRMDDLMKLVSEFSKKV